MSSWNDEFLQRLFLDKIPLIDVRAPVEFTEGSIPHSVNLPLMKDLERHQVGLCYKEHGQAAAIELGHRLVSHEVKEARVRAWLDFIHAHPKAEVFCFRGGLRSQISCQWINEAGLKKSPIPGGYKRLRQFFISWLNEAPLPALYRLGGLTGSGKTRLLTSLPHHLDLENLANHRGSAFGPRGPQPSQILFENEIALRMIQTKNLIIEDESSSIGQRRIPLRFFQHMRASPLIILERSLEERIQNIFEEYVFPGHEEFFLGAIQMISRKLGGLRTKNLTEEVKRAFARGFSLEDHSTWIAPLLRDYYDPIYLRDIQNQSPLILFKGSEAQVRNYLHDTLKFN